MSLIRIFKTGKINCTSTQDNISNIKEVKEVFLHWTLVAHVYNPSYSRGRNQEDLV
jgi:hypothetical protein